jgi:hypothetical protein
MLGCQSHSCCGRRPLLPAGNLELNVSAGLSEQVPDGLGLVVELADGKPQHASVLAQTEHHVMIGELPTQLEGKMELLLALPGSYGERAAAEAEPDAHDLGVRVQLSSVSVNGTVGAELPQLPTRTCRTALIGRRLYIQTVEEQTEWCCSRRC